MTTRNLQNFNVARRRCRRAGGRRYCQKSGHISNNIKNGVPTKSGYIERSYMYELKRSKNEY